MSAFLMQAKLLRAVLALAVLLVSGLACFSTSANPPGMPIEETQVAITPSASTEAPQPAVTERRLLILEWPKTMRQDDSELIRLSLEVDPQGNVTPTAVLGDGQELRGETVEIPNVFDTHNVVAEARLDLAGVVSEPSGIISEPLRSGSTVTFYWSIRADQPGRYRGTVWLYLHFVPLEEGKPEERIPLTAQLITIDVVNFLGLGGGPVRLVGGVGAALGFAFSLDGILPWLWKRIWGARRPMAAKR